MNKSKPVISIVIPCYNPDSDLLDHCLDSILMQEYQNFEIIIIDDGSNEKSSGYISELNKKDSRIRVHRQDNMGVSIARNRGTELASGEYITYIDADDLINPVFFKEAIDIITKNNLDVVIGAVKVCHNSEEVSLEKESNSSKYKVLNRTGIEEFRPRLISDLIRFDDSSYISRASFARLIKASIAKEIQFPERIPYGEDIIWNQNLLKKCNSIGLVKSTWYYYLFNCNSAVNRYNPQAIINATKELKVLSSVIDLSDEQYYISFCNHVFEELRCRVCSSCLTNPWNKNKYNSCRKEFEKIIKLWPWSTVTSKKYFQKLKAKSKVKILLLRTHLFFPVVYIIDRKKRATSE